MSIKNKTVFVGVSGGVDSSVSAALLKDKGYDVVGVFIRTWTPDFIDCTWRDERRDAMRVCAHLGIPFLECDAEEAYKRGVADYMIEEYKKGNTPNPDVMCNREVKFGVFWDFARAHGADYIATGHYARISPLLPEEGWLKAGVVGAESNHHLPLSGTPPLKGGEGMQLCKSPDQSKDQSYFLWTLTQDDLAHVMFPVGHLQKTEVRKLAEKYNLPVATKKDSQGVCFLGPLDMKDFLKHYIKSERGEVLDEKGNTIGEHDGAVFFTLGERHGFTITKHTSEDTPLYVVAKDIEKNTITVSPKTVLEEMQAMSVGVSIYKIKNTNWSSVLPSADRVYTAQIRYHGEFLSCKVSKGPFDTTNSAEINFEQPILVSPGQSIVVYDGDICLGGGVVI
jgi:tRNA-uridine 2-sulfurtransferase